MVAPQYIADMQRALAFIGDQIPEATDLWVGGHNAKAAISELGSPRTVLLESFEAMNPHLDRLREATA